MSVYTVTVLVEAEDGTAFVTRYTQPDPHHAMIPLDDAGGWAWASSDFGRDARETAATKVGWALQEAHRRAKAGPTVRRG